MRDYTVTTFDLLRHGLPEGGEIFRGSTDVALSDKGFEQMLAAEDKLADRDIIITSPLQRCRSFAEQLSQRSQKQVVQDASLREVSFGDWDGMSFDDVKSQYAEKYMQYWQDPINNSPPNAEPIPEFSQRISHAIEALAVQHKGKKLLLVTHGGVIRAALSYALGNELNAMMRYEVPYASISQIKIYHDSEGLFPQLVFHNR